MKSTFYPLCIVTILFFGACEKDSGTGNQNNNIQPPPKTKTELLTAHQWSFKAQYFGLPGTKLDDVTFSLPACYFDNKFTFNSNGTFTHNEGAKVCSGEPASYSGTWVISSDQKFLTATSTHDTTKYTLGVLTEDKLEIRWIDDPGGSFPFEIMDEYIK